MHKNKVVGEVEAFPIFACSLNEKIKNTKRQSNLRSATKGSLNCIPADTFQ